jgi:predicted alpha/beta-fold hydrolase
MKLGGYLAKQYDDSAISYAMVVSAPFNAKHSTEELEKSQYVLFNKILTYTLSKMFNK